MNVAIAPRNLQAVFNALSPVDRAKVEHLANLAPGSRGSSVSNQSFHLKHHKARSLQILSMAIDALGSRNKGKRWSRSPNPSLQDMTPIDALRDEAYSFAAVRDVLYADAAIINGAKRQ